MVSKATLEKHGSAWVMSVFALSMDTFPMAAGGGSVSRRLLQQIDVTIPGNRLLNKYGPNLAIQTITNAHGSVFT
jgi:hypothetical protein